MDTRWYLEAFGELFPLLYPHRDAAAAERELAALLPLLKLDAGARVLDLCCGFGRHSRALKDRGFSAVGLDLSPEMLGKARRENPALPLIQADNRALPLSDESFDAVLLLFTSWGYFEDRLDDLRVLEEAHRVLREGGLFVLDFMNARTVRSFLVDHEESERAGWRFLVDRRIDEERNRVIKTIRARGPQNQERSFTESVYLYGFGEIERLLAERLFELVDRFGDLDGRDFVPTISNRFVTVSRKISGDPPQSPG